MSIPVSPPKPILDLDTARQVAVEAVEAAGAMLRARFADPMRTRVKSASGDVVTDLDVAAEQLIVDRLRRAYPDHRILAEESGAAGATSGEMLWLVDPLDGTNNVAIGMPIYAVGVALCDGREPVLGAVHDPVSARTWSAVRRAGAYGPGGAPLRATPRPLPGPTERPVLAWTQGHEVDRADPVLRALKSAVEHASRRMLQLWAPLVGWMMLARGDIDGIVGYQAELIDLPPGALIAREAGVEIRGLDGGPYDLGIDRPAARRCFVAARPGMMERLLETTRAAFTHASAIGR